jgi:hypothetical protein
MIRHIRTGVGRWVQKSIVGRPDYVWARRLAEQGFGHEDIVVKTCVPADWARYLVMGGLGRRANNRKFSAPAMRFVK